MRAMFLAIFLAGCSGGVPVREVLDVAAALEEQAGTGDEARALLLAAERRGDPPERAEAVRRRCGLEHAVSGPAVALPVCRTALDLAVGRDFARRAERRTSLVLAALGRGEEAEAMLPSSPAPDGLEAALGAWARVEVHRARSRTGPAAGAAEHAREALRVALIAGESLRRHVADHPERDEFLAIADWQSGRAAREAGEPVIAEGRLDSALRRQRALDAANPSFAEYRLYLVRILREIGRLPGREAERAEGDALGAELLRRDPARWEYGAGL